MVLFFLFSLVVSVILNVEIGVAVFPAVLGRCKQNQFFEIPVPEADSVLTAALPHVSMVTLRTEASNHRLFALRCKLKY
jgi:hypothetical protein